MKIRVLIIFIFLAIVFVPTAFARNVIVKGTVDMSQTAITAGNVVFSDVLSKTTFTTSITPIGAYFLTLPEGVYDVTIIPASGNKITKYHQEISSNTTLNVAIAPSHQVSPAFPLRGVSIGFVVVILMFGIGLFIWKRRK